MAKSKNFIIPLVIYPFDVLVSINEPDEQLFKLLSKYGIDKSEHKNASFDRGDGRYCLFSGGQSLLRVRHFTGTNDDYARLQHEIFHCVSSILWRIGMKLKIKSSDEAYAYLIQYLTETIYDKL